MKNPLENKFHKGNPDGKHYWLTPPDLMEQLNKQYSFDFDPCPYPKPEEFDGLTCEWGKSNYVNPPFGSIIHQGRKKGMTAWVRKALDEHKKGKRVVMVYPIDKWVLMLVEAGAKITNLGDVKWCATEDGSRGKGLGRHIACFALEPRSLPLPAHSEGWRPISEAPKRENKSIDLWQAEHKSYYRDPKTGAELEGFEIIKSRRLTDCHWTEEGWEYQKEGIKPGWARFKNFLIEPQESVTHFMNLPNPPKGE